MTNVIANGSRWWGEGNGDLDELFEVLANHPLRACFDPYEMVLDNGVSVFLGNFDVSHVFNVATDDPEMVVRLRGAIEANQNRWPGGCP